jgi:hypothetical protein
VPYPAVILAKAGIQFIPLQKGDQGGFSRFGGVEEGAKPPLEKTFVGGLVWVKLPGGWGYLKIASLAMTVEFALF